MIIHKISLHHYLLMNLKVTLTLPPPPPAIFSHMHNLILTRDTNKIEDANDLHSSLVYRHLVYNSQMILTAWYLTVCTHEIQFSISARFYIAITMLSDMHISAQLLKTFKGWSLYPPPWNCTILQHLSLQISVTISNFTFFFKVVNSTVQLY